ncbi:oligosaccharide flippase family protein [Daejeonia sp. YH14]|uniref:oligosaccharide flippase family protein n=1 Tax=Daejeonia sp. YH14 TaxID=3439042 RepID=UPI003F494CC0
MSAFGGVQFIGLATGIFRSKIAAVWLGTQGVGFLGMILSAFNLIVGSLNLGLPTSITKHISGASESSLPKMFGVINFLSLIIGFASAFFCFAFASQLSETTFGNIDYTWAFRLLSVSVFFKQMTNIYAGILQGTDQLKKLANANIIANVSGILVTVPLYYFFQIKGIIYNLVCIGFIEVLVFYLYYKSLKIKKKKVSQKEFKAVSQKIVGDGFFFNLSGFLTLLSAYILQMFISNYGDLKILGFYVSGFTILNTYVAIIFTAMSVDYFPRISKIDAKNHKSLNQEVNYQLYIGLIILFPILLLLLLLSHLVIILLYSANFLETEIYLQFAMLGVFFKLFSWTVGFVILAKGSRRMILGNALIYNTLFLVVHVLGFYMDGIRGIAIASSLYFFVHLLGNYWITYRKLGVRIDNKIIKMYIPCCLVIIFCVLINFAVQDFWIRKGVVTLITLAASVWSFRHLNSIFGWIK